VVTARRLTTAAAVVGLLVGLRLVAGVWITATVTGGLVTVGLVAGLAALERRVFAHRPATPPVTGPRGPGRHTEFARALTAVAAAYLAECQANEDEQRGMWR
jgi:hypothetical protein